MDITKGMQQLSELCKGKDWFFDVGTDNYGRLVVYTKWCSEEILRFVPGFVEGVQVLVHFAGSKTVKKDDFAAAPKKPVLELVDESWDDNEDVVLPVDVGALARELDRLEKVCGSNVLQDIFYEIHDGKNAVTNLSAKFPDVKKSLDKLYDEYGFDVIYEEMDG